MREKILEMLVDVCEDDAVAEDLTIDLFEEGLLDSLGVAQLLMETEDRLGVVIGLTEIERSDIDTPEKIIALIERKAGA
ncbi:MAG: D-alanine--poly(phosphoribitol) ligase subunit DltC [Blautia sp.]|nr:D-alanine--poly(phosphoribitol) ligase subunit DltC [Blautia sp.]